MNRPSGSGPTVVGIGAVAVDHLVYVNQPYPAGKGRIVRRSTTYGGNVATALAAVASLGGRARYAGFLPDHTQWGGVHADLEGLGVDLTVAREVAGLAPIQSTILVTPDDQRFIAFDDDTLVGGPIDLDLQVVATADALLIDGYGAEAGLRALHAAGVAGIPVIGDLELVDLPGLDALVAAIGHLVVPLSFATQLTGQSKPQAAVTALWSRDRQAVVVTDGERGSWFTEHHRGPVHHASAHQVDTVDTNGCGDVFHGTYSWAVAAKQTVSEAVALASAAAAICATGSGGRGRLPTVDTIAALTRTAPSYV